MWASRWRWFAELKLFHLRLWLYFIFAELIRLMHLLSRPSVPNSKINKVNWKSQAFCEASFNCYHTCFALVLGISFEFKLQFNYGWKLACVSLLAYTRISTIFRSHIKAISYCTPTQSCIHWKNIQKLIRSTLLVLRNKNWRQHIFSIYWRISCQG